MKDGRESGKRSLTRILVLGSTFFMVGLCPAVEMALAVFTLGTAVYSLLWWHEAHENKKKNKRVVISLFDCSGVMVEPWLEAGCECWIVDTRHPPAFSGDGVSTGERGIRRVHHDLSTPWLYPGDRADVAMAFAFPPCDHLAVSGARWFRGKGLRLLSKSIELFASAGEFCEWMGAPYLIENPVSAISTHWRKPDYVFHPYQYTGYCRKDNYTKKTCLWTGNDFAMPAPLLLPGLGKPDHRIHTAPPSPDRSMRRSMTPKGFARAVFESNRHVLRTGK